MNNSSHQAASDQCNVVIEAVTATAHVEAPQSAAKQSAHAIEPPTPETVESALTANDAQVIDSAPQTPVESHNAETQPQTDQTTVIAPPTVGQFNSIIPSNLNGTLPTQFNEARRFIECLTGSAAAVCCFRTFDDDKSRKDPRLSRNFDGTIDNVWESLNELQAQGAGVFIVINDGGHKDAEITQTRATFVDFDPPETAQQPATLPLKPSIEVESSPGRTHVYWMHNERWMGDNDVTRNADVEAWRDVQQRAINILGSDPSIKNLSRVMRLPGSVHLKDRRHLHVVRIIHQSDRRYSKAEIEAAFPAIALPSLKTAGTSLQPARNARKYQGQDFFRQVNDAALGQLDQWVTDVFPAAQPYQDGFRVSSAALGRSLQEDLSLLPTGIQDFGTEQAQTAVDVVMAHRSMSSEHAALWLCERLGIDPVSLGWKAPSVGLEAAIAQYNEKYFMVRIKGKPFVVETSQHDMLGEAMSPSHFRQFNANDQINQQSVAIEWLKHPQRRTFKQLDFNPAYLFGPSPDGEAFNCYRGLSIKPAKTGLFQLIFEHIHDIWCSSDEVVFRYVISWLALLVQKPHIKPRVAIVLKSLEGTGKTIITDILLRIFGQHGFTAAHKTQIAGQFNGHLFDKVLIVLEEAFFAGDHAAVAALKALITNPNIGYEDKGKPAFTASNFAHLFILSNEDWAVPASLDSRRFLVLDVKADRKGDRRYFEALADQIEHGGREGFLHELLNFDIKDFNPDARPITDGLRNQQIETLMRQNPPLSWLYTVLSSGTFTYDGREHDWEDGDIETQFVSQSYAEFTKNQRSAPKWIQAIKKINACLAPHRFRKIRPRNSPHDRSYAYILPSLEEARATFQTFTGIGFSAETDV